MKHEVSTKFARNATASLPIMSFFTLLALCMPFLLPGTSNAQAAAGNQTNSQPKCTDPPCPGSGGGGGPVQPSPALNWGPFVSESTSGSQYAVGGTPQRYGVGAVVANRYLYVAYTSPDSYIHLTYATAGSGYALNPEAPIYFDNGAPIYGAASNPALGSDSHFYLYLAWIDTNGILNYVKSTSPANGPQVHWGNGATQLRAITSNQIDSLIYSPSIAILPSPDNTQETLYISAVEQANPNDQNTRSLWLASQNLTQASFPTWTNFPQYSNIGMSPGLGVFNHTLFIAFPALDNSHSLYYYTTTDGANLSLQTGATGDSSSSSPSLAVFNNYLYMAFRTNDGDHKFIWKYSSNGVNWSGSTSIGQAMGGPPAIVFGNNLQSDPGHLINIFVADNSTQYLYAGETQ